MHKAKITEIFIPEIPWWNFKLFCLREKFDVQCGYKIAVGTWSSILKILFTQI